jgi:hypothetical protein
LQPLHPFFNPYEGNIIFVNNKYLIQLIAYVLLGLVAVAHPHKRAQPHVHGKAHQLCDTAAKVQTHTAKHHVQAVFHCNLPSKRQAKIKSRFRAVSFYQICPNDITRLEESLYPVTVNKLGSRINTTHLPPFYYLFLFRLTPF